MSDFIETFQQNNCFLIKLICKACAFGAPRRGFGLDRCILIKKLGIHAGKYRNERTLSGKSNPN
jgi:hypothetical protein